MYGHSIIFCLEGKIRGTLLNDLQVFYEDLHVQVLHEIYNHDLRSYL